jgi:hypothetical protein
VWGEWVYAGRPNYLSYATTGVDVLSRVDLSRLGSWNVSTGAHDEAGYALAAADLDRDGVPEVAVGRPGEEEVIVVRGEPHGQADLMDAPIHRFEGDTWAGSSLAFAAPEPGAPEELVIGSEVGVWAIDPLASSRSGPDEAIRALTGDWVFGWRVAVLDLDGDAQNDWVAAGTDISWFPGSWSGTLLSQDRAAAWTGDAVVDGLGIAVEAVGDVDGDGHEDVAFSAPMHHAPAERAGRGYLVPGGPSVTGGVADELGAQFRGVEVGEGMGWAFAGADLDGDGQQDLLMAASGVFPGQQPGQVLGYPGPVCEGIRTASDATWVVHGESAMDLFGRALLATDADGDGRDDLLVAALGAPQATGAGEVYLILGSSLDP